MEKVDGPVEREDGIFQERKRESNERRVEDEADIESN